jgi:hypothetical protein
MTQNTKSLKNTVLIAQLRSWHTPVHPKKDKSGNPHPKAGQPKNKCTCGALKNPAA